MRIRILFICLYANAITLIAQNNDNKMFSLDITNDSELQYNLSDSKQPDPKFVNLLKIESALNTDKWWKDGLFEASFWTIGQSMKSKITHDILSFSNIEEDNHWILFSKLGYQHTIGNMKLFVGVRNVDLDYFNTPYSSFFTNSSAGLYPTITANYHGVACYPFAALGMHAEYENKGWNFKNSFYNNINDAYNRAILKYHFNPKRYGFSNFTQVAYTSSNGMYAVGAVLDKIPNSAANHSLYALVEQSVTQIGKHKVGFIGQVGYAPKHRNFCYLYYGGGVLISNLLSSKEMDQLGLIVMHANAIESETALELTYKYTFNSYFSVQPALHCISDKDDVDLVGLIRGTFTFGL